MRRTADPFPGGSIPSLGFLVEPLPGRGLAGPCPVRGRLGREYLSVVHLHLSERITSEPSKSLAAEPWQPVVPNQPSTSPTTERPPGAGPSGTLDPESSPTFRELRGLLERGDYAAAVLLAYSSAFDGTVRAFGLKVPISCSHRRFLKEFLRPDMGRLLEMLPDLYRRYEPVRFGEERNGDRASLRVLLERMYSETPLARIHDPLYQPASPPVPGERASEYDQLFGQLHRKERVR